MVHAQIKDGLIVNIIVTNEDTPLELFSLGYDALIRVDEIQPMPGIGYKYDGNNFIAPDPSYSVIPDETNTNEEV